MARPIAAIPAPSAVPAFATVRKSAWYVPRFSPATRVANSISRVLAARSPRQVTATTSSRASKLLNTSSRPIVTSRSRWDPISSPRTGIRSASHPAIGDPAIPATAATPSRRPTCWASRCVT